VGRLLGWFVPQVLGWGYEYVGDASERRMALQLMALLVFLKLLATTTSYGSATLEVFLVPACLSGQCLVAPLAASHTT